MAHFTTHTAPSSGILCETVRHDGSANGEPAVYYTSGTLIAWVALKRAANRVRRIQENIMHQAVLIIATAIATLFTANPANAGRAAKDLQYTASYQAERGVYCIRFFSDSWSDPRPNTAAATCMTRARWAQQRVFIQHRRSTDEIAAR